ncbi:hypothetical protein MBAV_004644 [Candidatus Magnetobacterium bavaricum]|uniref:Uncharacterized protein n=1 Tax=Candidatus Magnetobacterium bavaricum TaxID=29290 RepID=A0A0F3GMK5_9BACT|nr:hypothetical protein MBAV_004644 [Candidatus Magnetobacterium bavaricum]
MAVPYASASTDTGDMGVFLLIMPVSILRLRIISASREASFIRSTASLLARSSKLSKEATLPPNIFRNIYRNVLK